MREILLSCRILHFLNGAYRSRFVESLAHCINLMMSLFLVKVIPDDIPDKAKPAASKEPFVRRSNKHIISVQMESLKVCIH